MAEILSPGVYIEEVASSQNVIAGVSTSNVGAIGFTPQGPTDTATLITSLPQFQRIFGGDTKNSLLAKSIYAFYANGGRRAFVVRVVPSDAVLANGRIQSTTTNQLLLTGDGAATTYSETNPALSVLKDNEGYTPLVPGTFTAKFRGVGAALADDITRARNGTTALIGSGTKLEGRVDPYKHAMLGTTTGAVHYRVLSTATTSTAVTVAHVVGGVSTPLTVVVVGNAITVNLATDGGGLPTSTASDVVTAVSASGPATALVAASVAYAGTLAAAAPTALTGMPVIDPDLDAFTNANITLKWKVGTVTKTLVFSGNASVLTASNADGSGTIDKRSGVFSLVTAATMDATPILVSATTASDTNTLTSASTVSTLGRATLSGAVLDSLATNYVNVADGTYSFTLSSANSLHNKGKVLVSYTTNAWEVQPISKGVWGNSLRLDIAGDPNWFDATTNTYSKFNVTVSMLDSVTGSYIVMETYEELVFDDPESAVYFPDVLNELSDYVRIVEPGGDEAPGQLNGVAHTMSLGGGDDTLSSKAFNLTLAGAPIAPRSVVVTYTSAADGATETLKDNGNGIFSDSVDIAATNSITYSTGAVEFSTKNAVKAGTLVTIQYRSAATETTHTEKLGDTAKAYTYTLTVGGVQKFYTAGTDGTFGSTTYGRNQFTEASLAASNKGVYALDRVDELMQVIVPDFAGDETITGDLLDYANSRASSASGGDRFIILTTPKGCNPQEAVDWFRYTLGRYSKFAALYWPWVLVSDPLSNGRTLAMPPLGHVAGVYARTDITRNVGKSPGGTVDGALAYLNGLEYVSTLGERDYVYPNKINPLIESAQTGLAVWGVRTIAQESEWRYINARRLFMFVEKSVFNSTHWIVFENNGPELWSRISGQLGGFLLNLYNSGYFAGNSPSQAFFVTCDSSNNPQSSIDAGQVIIDVGIAPNKPAEFVRFRFQQKSL